MFFIGDRLKCRPELFGLLEKLTCLLQALTVLPGQKALCVYDLHVSLKLEQMEACSNGDHSATNVKNSQPGRGK